MLADAVRINQIKQRIDSISAFRPSIATENEEDLYPALGLYNNDWNTNSVNPYRNHDLPESFAIDVSAWCMPCMGSVTSNYGFRSSMHRFHYGIDLKITVGEPIHAAFDGKVRVVAIQPGGYGQVIVIRHSNGLETVYGHLSRQFAKVGQYVKAGEVIGLGGNTGHSTGPHLHFETRFLGIAINPAEIFDFQNKVTHMDTYVFFADANRRKKGETMANAEGLAYHKVQLGDTLYSIAEKYGTTVDILRHLNRIRNGVIKLGQLIRTV
jgi:Membrane proteins related to metalloendopeptidases